MMDAALDFTRRARHAWLEFRQPSKLNVHDANQQGESDEQRGHHPAHDPSVNDPNQRTPLENYRLLVGSMFSLSTIAVKWKCVLTESKSTRTSLSALLMVSWQIVVLSYRSQADQAQI